MKGKTEQLRKRLLTPVIGGREGVFRWFMLAVFAAGLLYVLVRGVFEQPRVPDNFTNSHSASPGGHLALARLLGELGYRVERRVTPLNRLGPEFYAPGGSCLTLLEPSPDLALENKREFAGLFAQHWRSPNVILALPRRFYSRAPGNGADGVIEVLEHEYPVRDVNAVLQACGLSGISVERVGEQAVLIKSDPRPTLRRAPDERFHDIIDAPPRLDDILLTRLHDQPAQVFRFDSPSTAADFMVLIETDDGRPVAVAARDSSGRPGAVLLSDPDILSNRFLGEGRAAALASLLFAHNGCRTFEIDESMHGLATQASIEYLAATPPGLWFTLSLFVVLLLFGWREATVLRPVEAETEARRSRGVVIEGVARMMSRARDYTAAATALLRRAHAHLGAGAVQVHASGMAGSTASGPPRDLKDKLEAVKVIPGEGPMNVVRAARIVSELRREQRHGRAK